MNYKKFNPDVSFNASYFMKLETMNKNKVELGFVAKHEFSTGPNISAGVTISGTGIGGLVSGSFSSKTPLIERPENETFTTKGTTRFTEKSEEVRFNFSCGWDKSMKIGAKCNTIPNSLTQCTKYLRDGVEFFQGLLKKDKLDSEELFPYAQLLAFSEIGELEVEVKEPDWNLRIDSYCSASRYHNSPNTLNIENNDVDVKAIEWFDSK